MSSYYSEQTDEEDPEAYFCQYGYRVRPATITAADRIAVRKAVRAEEWRFERRGGYVKPPKHWGGCRFPLSDLGECGDRKCGNYRL
eukprot:4590010-Amphidinium_carterae.1